MEYEVRKPIVNAKDINYEDEREPEKKNSTATQPAASSEAAEKKSSDKNHR
jgi:hypothetical protein